MLGKRQVIFIALILVVFLISGCVSSNSESSGIKVTLYKSPNCGCCVKHTAYLEDQGFQVDVRLVDNMQSIKDMYQIPMGMQSCHTAIIGNYFVEGHVPVEAINKLLEEQPDIDGIALPGMPAGSPGMPGIKAEPFKIYAIKDGNISLFMTI